MKEHQSRIKKMDIVGMANMGLNVGLNAIPQMQHSHRHDEIELNFVEKGAIAYLFAGRPTLVEVSQLALFWAATPHQLVWATEETRLHWLTIPLPLFLQWNLPANLIKQVLGGELLVNEITSETLQIEIYKRFFEQWEKDLHSDFTQQNQPQACLLELQAFLLRLALKLTLVSNPGKFPTFSEVKLDTRLSKYQRLDKVEEMASFITENHTRPLSIQQIAQSVNLHPNYAMRIFQRVYGVSLLNYLTQHRLAHAQRLLATTEHSIAEVAFEAGFSSISRFYTIFKSSCGVAPYEYRKSVR